MRLLLDPHTYLWFVGRNCAALPGRTVKIIGDAAHTKFVSFASRWEISVTAGLGKLTLPFGLDELCDDQLSIMAFYLSPSGSITFAESLTSHTTMATHSTVSWSPTVQSRTSPS